MVRHKFRKNEDECNYGERWRQTSIHTLSTLHDSIGERADETVLQACMKAGILAVLEAELESFV